MSESNLSHKADFWRRVAHFSAWLCFARTLVPSEVHIGDLWAAAGRLHGPSVLSQITGMNLSIKAHNTILPTTLFQCFTTAIVAPLLIAVLTSRARNNGLSPSGSTRTLSLVAFSIAVFSPAITLIDLMYAAGNPQFHAHKNPDVFLDVFFLLFIVHLVQVGLVLLLWKDRRGTNLETPLLLALPVLFTGLYWTSLLVFQITAGVFSYRLTLSAATSLISLVMLVSLFQYARAVRIQKPPDSPLRHS